jgi:hypothetical protein
VIEIPHPTELPRLKLYIYPTDTHTDKQEVDIEFEQKFTLPYGMRKEGVCKNFKPLL